MDYRNYKSYIIYPSSPKKPKIIEMNISGNDIPNPKELVIYFVR